MNNIDKQLIEEFNKLPDDYWDFKNADTKELTHSIHNYPAIMVYPISRNIISTVKKYQEIESLLDPFMGSGTVLLEGLLAGIDKIYGNDLNPLAYRIAKAKTKVLDPKDLCVVDKLIKDINKKYAEYSEVLDGVNEYIKKNNFDITAKIYEKGNWGECAPKILNQYLHEKKVIIRIPDIKNLGFWFVPKCVLELAIIKMEIDKIENIDIKDYIMIAFSETTRIVSNRRNGEFKMYRMKPEKVKIFNPDVKGCFYNILDENVKKMIELSNRLENRESSDIKLSLDDASILKNVPDNSVDLVITSPPYGDSKTTVAYGQFSRVSLQWCDYDRYTYKDIVDIDKNLMGGTTYKKGYKFDIKSETLKASLDKILEYDKNLERAGDVYSFYKDLSVILATVTRKCRNNGYQFWVVGNRTVKEVQLPTDKILVEIGKHEGLEHVMTLGRNISNKVMPSENSPTNEIGKKVKTMNKELIVIFRKEV